MSIVITTTKLFPVRRDKQISSPGGSISASSGAGSTSVGITSHPLLTELDYASSGHIGFAPSDSPLFTGTVTLSSSTIVPDGGSIGQAAGPLITFDDTNNYLEITSCAVGIGFTAPLSALCINGGVHIGGESAAGDNNLIVDGTSLISGVATFNDDLIGNESFVSGFAGSGWKLDKTTDYSLTVDNLTVRKSMKIYELEINKIKSVNGGIMISAASGKAYSVEDINFNTWHNTAAWTTLTFSGLNITAANNASGTKDIYISKTPIDYPTSVLIPWLTGEVITFTCTLTYTSGAYPSVIITENGSIVVNQALVAGVNTITYTTTGNYTNNVILLRTIGAAVFTLTSVSCPFLHVNKIVFDEDEATAGTGNIIQFEANDYIRAQEWTGRGVDSYLGKVLSVVHSATLGSAYARVMCTTTCWEGAELVQVGNSTETDRQSLIYLTAAETNNPYIQMLSGVTDGVFTGHTKVMLGNLEAIASTGIVPATPGFGLFCDNVYLTGKIVLPTAGMTDDGSSASSVRIYAGDTYANRATAPFRVTQDGSLTAVGVAEIGTATVTVDSKASNVAILGPDIWENSYDGDDSGLHINRLGYNKGATHFRDITIYNGKNTAKMLVCAGSQGCVYVGNTSGDPTKLVVQNTASFTGIPTSNAGLSAGDLYRDGAGADAVLKVK